MIGGAGFLGRYVVRALVARGHAVTVVGRRPEPQGLPDGARYVERDSLDGMPARISLLLECDHLVDLAYATVPKSSYQDPVHDMLANLPEAVRWFEAACAADVRRVVWVSSGGTVYGPPSRSTIDEDHPQHPISPYGITKLAIEHYAYMYFYTRGLSVTCVRPSNAYGPEQRPYVGQGFIATAIASILDARTISLFGEGSAVRDHLHVEDMAAGIVAALERGRPGEVYNLGSGCGRSIASVLETIEAIARRDGLSVQRDLRAKRPFDVESNVLDTTKLRNHTDWSPRIDFDHGIESTWQWYRDHTEFWRGTPD